MNHFDLVERLKVALDFALKDMWDEPIPVVNNSLKIGLLIQTLKMRVPQFWFECPESLAKHLTEDYPELAAEVAKYDPRVFGFVARTHRFILKGREHEKG